MTFALRRRRSVPALLAATLASALALTGCSGSNDTAEAASDDAYTVTHAMGDTVIEGTPERVVVLDSPHLDALVALCLLYTSPSPRDKRQSRMPSSA